jgi:hypothetical protein
MVLKELGHKYPVSTKGVLIDLEDESQIMGPGDIVEAWYEADRDIDYLNIAPAIKEVIKMKEDYPDFVLHYIRFDTRRVYVQFSAAPPENAISTNPQKISTSIQAITWLTVVMILAIAAIITAFIAVTLRAIRGYWWTPPPPTGNALAVAKDWVTEDLIPNVKISVDNMEGVTGPNGEAILFEDLQAGPHVFVGETIDDYQSPDAVEKSVIEDEQIMVTIWYIPEGVTPPTTGYLVIDTTPIKGEVFVQGISYGEAPVGPVELDVGTYPVAYGAIEGWDTPPPDTATIRPNKTESLIGYYTQPSEGWEKYLKYAVIGGLGIAGATLLIPEIIRATARRGERE